MFVEYGCDRDYSKKIENKLSKNPKERYQQIQKIAFNLKINSTHLVSTYSPEDIVDLNDYMLAEKSPIETARKKIQEGQKQYHELTKEDFLKEQGFANSECIKCKYCQKHSLEFTTKQTRSADEGSTVFFMCTNFKCGKRWKM
jgi:DNA-directed RNA polymerase subunit M/transcription elongation factor TFIIS